MEADSLIARKTKVVCTLGPSSWEVETILSLIDAGMSVARFNMSHGDHDSHRACLRKLREACALRPLSHVALCLDSKGPEVRTGFLEPGVDSVKLTAGSTLALTTDMTHAGNEKMLSCTYARLPAVVRPGATILVADGALVLRVTECRSDSILCRVENGAEIGSYKNVTLPDLQLDLPVLSPKDVNDLVNFGVKEGFDFVAASFVQSAEDVRVVRRALQHAGGGAMKIISKIENQAGLTNFDEIVTETDAVMVARGDLGTHIPPERVFREQKRMVGKCRRAGKPVVVATQMLESMIDNPRPTRAECSDVANAVLDGADCLMLSGETANGRFPHLAVSMMARTCLEAESFARANDPSGYEEIFDLMKAAKSGRLMTPEESAASSAVKCSIDVGAKAIIVLSTSGRSARLLAKYHPDAKIIAVSNQPGVARQLEGYLSNTTSILTNIVRGDGSPHVAVALVGGKKRGLFKVGDTVVVLHTVRNALRVKEWTIRLVNVALEDDEDE